MPPPPDAPVQFLVFDIDGVPRGKLLSRAKVEAGLGAGLGFCDVVFGWDVADAPYDGEGVTGWSSGYPDARVRFDVAEVRDVPWEGAASLVVGDFDGGHLGAVCPRTLLRRVVERAGAAGFRVAGAVEYEWFNFVSGGAPEGEAAGGPTPVTAGMRGYSPLRTASVPGYTDAVWRGLDTLGVPLEGLHTETGPGAYEAAYHHAEGLELADRAALLKLGVKRIGSTFGITSGFMAKWSTDLPGCGGHLHQSLVDADGANLFADAGAPDGLSATGRHYLAGQLLWLPRLLALYAPTVNSYKRLVPGSWAPTHVGWGVDNRTAAIRLVPAGPATRLELRVPGADANPYLVAAAAIASGLDGIARALPLELPPLRGNAYAQTDELAPLATNLSAATAELTRHRDAAAELLGGTFVDHFLRTRDWEWRRSERAVTDYERSRYLEII